MFGVYHQRTPTINLFMQVITILLITAMRKRNIRSENQSNKWSDSNYSKCLRFSDTELMCALFNGRMDIGHTTNIMALLVWGEKRLKNNVNSNRLCPSTRFSPIFFLFSMWYRVILEVERFSNTLVPSSDFHYYFI